MSFDHEAWTRSRLGAVREAMRTAIVPEMTYQQAWEACALDGLAADTHPQCEIAKKDRGVLHALERAMSAESKLARVKEIRDEFRDHQDRSPVNVDTLVEMLTEAMEDVP